MTNADNKAKPTGSGRIVLTPEQRSRYALSMEQTEAVFALEDMFPGEHDRAINPAILDRRVTLQEAHAELLAYDLEYEATAGFVTLREWAR